MTNPDRPRPLPPSDEASQSLRERAERTLLASPAEIVELSPTEVQAMVHELRAHQIELEMQNEELRRSQFELAKAHDRYAALYDFAPVGYLTFDTDSMIVEANVTLAQMLGVEREALVGSRITDHVKREDQDILYLHRRAVLRHSQRQRCELELTRADGTCLPVQLDSVNERHDEKTRIRGVLIDITERRAAAAAQKEAECRRNAFLATLAHELRNPLAPIRNALEILNLTPADSALASEARLMIDRQLTHMVRLIDDLMDVNRITQGRIVLQPALIDLNDLLHDLVDTFSATRRAHPVSLSLTLPDKPMMLHADPARLVQVFTNLLDNAFKFAGDQGRIEVVASRKLDEAVVTISDDGVGIPPADLPHIFEMFSQGRVQEGHQGADGLGIGLWLAAGLLKLHGGSIEAQSEGRDQGSRFIVRLPLSSRAATPPGPDIARVESDQEPLRILVVDDDEAVVRSTAMLLGLDGHKVLTAFDGRSALALAAQERPDVVLMDIGMSDLDGYETCRQLRQTDWGRSMRIYALTGWGGDAIRQQVQDAGFDAHLVKPVSPNHLRHCLARPTRD